MPKALNGNDWFLSLNGFDVSGFITEVEMSSSNSTVDRTAGAGRRTVQRAAGLDDYSGKIIIAYFPDSVPDYIRSIKPGHAAMMVSGPEGALPGKPKHQQSIIFNQVAGPKQTVAKDLVVFEASWEGEDEPLVNLYEGGVFA